MFVELVGETQLSTKDVLTPLHVAIEIVLVGGDGSTKHWSNHRKFLQHLSRLLIEPCHDCRIKERQPVVEGALAAATHDSNKT